MSLLVRCAFITDHIEIWLIWTNMTNSSRSSVYVNGRIDFLLAIKVQSDIIDKQVLKVI